MPDINNDFNYHPFLFKEKDNDDTYKEQYGIKTTGLTKPLMVGCLLEFINEDHSCIRSKDLISQFSTISKASNGSIKSTSYSDLFMAACFCAFTRRKKAIEIMPLVEFSNTELQNKFMNDIKDIATMTDPKTSIKRNAMKEKMIFDLGDEDIILPESNNEIDMFIPFFMD